MKDDTSQLSKLGNQDTEYKFTGPHASMLEVFPNQFPDRSYIIVHKTDEFTSLCPKTGQPDFAAIRIEYIADVQCVETKSLKLYLFAFRNEGTFMETIVNRILEDLVAATLPRRMRVIGEFGARGGIATAVEANYVKEPDPNNGGEGN